MARLHEPVENRLALTYPYAREKILGGWQTSLRLGVTGLHEVVDEISKHCVDLIVKLARKGQVPEILEQSS
jgi:hypothetical protein